MKVKYIENEYNNMDLMVSLDWKQYLRVTEREKREPGRQQQEIWKDE